MVLNKWQLQMQFTTYTLLHWAISGINNNHVDLDSTIVCCTPWHKSYTSHSRVQSNKNYIVMWPIRSQSIHNSNKLQSFQNQSSGLIMFSISTWNLVSNNWTINHIQYNNDNENLKIHIQFTYSKQFNKVQVTTIDYYNRPEHDNTLIRKFFSDRQHWNLQRSLTQVVSTSNKRSSSGEMKKDLKRVGIYREMDLTLV